ncbi:MAG: hypothetical protein R2771_00135 [Saprospiraceae bacterium]
MTNDLITAGWYDKLISEYKSKTLYNIQYGKLLMKLGLYDKAKVQFESLIPVNKSQEQYIYMNSYVILQKM